MNNKPVDTPERQSATTGLESLEQAPSGSNATTVNASQNGASNSSSIQKRPSRPWKKQAILIVVLLLFVGGLSFAALRLSAKINQGTNSQDLAGSFKPVGNPVLGAESILPVQSLNDKTVTINGDLTVNGKLKLSAEAINDLAGVVGNKVSLSPTQGGPVQTGNISISGTVVASNFQGNGAGLSNLNASSVTSGTLSNDRLDASVTRLGQTIPLSALQSTVLSSLNGISNNGNVDIVGSGSLSVTTDPLTNQIVLSTSSGGDITSVIAGTGLIGGGATGDVTLDIDTGLVTVQGNTFNGASQLVKLNGAGELPVLSATNLTNLNASNLGTGTLNDARLGANVTLQGNTFNLANKLVKLDNSGNLPALNGSAITNLNASNLGTGTLNDARLSANVALLDASQTFTGSVAFSQPLQVNTIQPSAAMTIGATNQSLTLQGDLTTSLTGTGGTGTVSLGFTGTPVGTIAYQLDASAPAGTYTLCTTVGNCAGSGTGVTSLGGTTNKLAKFTGGQAIDDSSITDDGTLVTVGANALYKAGADSTTAFRIQNAAGSNNVFTADSTNNRVAIGQATAGYTLDVNGDINSATGLRVGGNLVCDSNGCAASGQSGFYIQNGTATQSAANFNIESTSNSTPTAVLKLKSSQTADLLQARDASNNVIAKIDASGNISTTGQFQVSGTQISSANLSNDANLAKLDGTQTFTAANLFRNAGDSTTAFRIQNAAASNLFVADTSNTRVAIGQATAGYTLDVNGDINITNGSSYRINGVAICGPTATCAPSSGSGSYVQNGLVSQTANFNIQSISSNSIVGILQGAVGQSADLFQARDSSNNVVFKIANSGITTITGTGISGSSLTLTPSTGNNFIIGGTNITVNPSNVLNLQGATASLATTVGHGNVTLSSLGVARLTVQDANSGGKIGIGNNMSSPQAQLHVLSSGSTVIGQIIQGAASQTADLFQARDSNNNVLAKITSSGAIYQGANQVCDTSNNCGYANGSGSGNYIQNGTTTQTANLNIQSASTTQPTAVIQGAGAQTADIFQVKDGTSQGNDILSVSQSTTNLVTNSSFEEDTSSWTSLGSSSISRTTDQVYSGNSSLQIVTSAGNQGAKFAYPLANGTQYTFSAYVRATTVYNFAYVGYSFDGSTSTVCGSPVQVSNLTWTRVSCTFTASATSGTPYVFVQSSFGGVKTMYVDAVQLEVGSVLNAFQVGKITLNGTIVSPTVFKNQSNSNSAFQIQNAAGTFNLFTADTANSRVGIGTSAPQSTLHVVDNAGGAGTGTVTLGASLAGAYASITGSGNALTFAQRGGGWYFKDLFQNVNNLSITVGNNNDSILQGSGSGVITLKSSSSASSALQVQNSVGTNLLSVGGTGAILAKNSTDSTTAFQVQNAAGATAINLNTAVNSTSWTTTGSISGTTYQSGSAVYNGRIYITGGGVGGSNIVKVATPDQYGTISSWTSLNSFTAARYANASFAYNDYLYVIGGTGLSDVQYAPINGDGTLGSWSATTSLPAVRAGMTASVYGGRVYLVGGHAASSINGTTDTLYATINGDGTLGSWNTATSFTTARTFAQSVVSNGKIYVIGGATNSNATTSNNSVQFAAINGDGTLSSWTAATNLPIARSLFGAAVNGNIIYITAGINGIGLSDSYSTTINGDGTIGSWNAGTNFASARYGHSTVINNGYLYSIGGYNTGYLTDVLYSAVSSASYANVLTVNGLLNNTGPALFKNNTDTTSAFQIQNAAGTSNLFTADTTNSRIAIGQASASYTLDVAGDINSTTAIRVGGNQVCDSTGCNVSSAASNVIKNQTTTQTGNLNLQSASTTSPTAVIQGANAQTADILQVKDGTSQGNTIFSVNQSASNLVSNPSFETDTAGWTAKGNAAISVSTAEKYIGNSSIQMVLTTAEDGIRFNYPLASSTTYTLSYYGKATTAINGTRCGRSDDGSTNTNGAVSTPNYPSTGWMRFTCTFTTGTTSGAPYFYIGRSVGGGTVFIDAVQLEVGSSATPYQMGTISLNGVVKSPTSFRNQSDSVAAFQVQNAAGTSIFNIDTVGGAVQTNLIQANYALALRAGGGGYVNLQDGSGRSMLTSYSDTGATKLRSYTANTGAFQIQDVNANTILNVDTTGNRNFITNPSFETDTAGWSITAGGSSLLRITTDQYSGLSSVRNTNTATANTGGRFLYQLAASSTYTFSMYAKAEGSNFSTLELGYNTDGTTYTSCLTAQTVTTTGWTRYSCTFTMPGTVSSNRFVYFRQTDATARSFLVDAFQLETGSTLTNYSLGNISLNGAVNSPAIFQNQSNSSNAFQIQNAAGDQILNIDSTTNNMVGNPSIETSTTGWSPLGSATLSRTTSAKYSGNAALQIAATAATGDGAKYPVALASSTTYSLSYYATNSVATAFTPLVGRSDDGSTETNCSPSPTTGFPASVVWTRYSCTFTTGTVSGSPYIYIKIPSATARTFYLDAVQLEAGSVASGYSPASISLNGAINSPILLRNQSDSSTAFQIQNAAGTTQMSFDTTGNGTLNIFNNANRALSLSNSKISNTSSTLQLEATGGNMVEIVNSGSSDTFPAFKVTGSTAAAVQAQIKGASAQTADIFQVQGGNSTSAILSVAQNNTNLISNPSFDLNTNGWSNFASTSASRITSDQYSGRGSMLISASAANSGMSFSYALAASATYSFSTYVKSSAEFSTYELGYTNNGSTFTSCATGQTVSSSWTRVSCTFTMSGAVSGSRFVYFRQTDATSRSFLVDATQLELASAPTNYSLGSLSLNGSINGPALFQNTSDSTSAFSVQNSSAASIFQVDTANSRVGIGNARPGNLLSVGALTLADPDAQLAVGTGGDSKKGIVIQAVAGQTADFFQAQDSTGAVLASIDPEGNLAVRNVTVSGHIISAGPVPTMELVGTATGTAPLSQIFGTDVAGVVVLAADVDGTGSGAFIHVTFAEQYTGIPMVVLTPSSEDAAILTGSSAVYAYGDPDGAGFTIAVGPGGLPTNVPYAWTYHVIQ